MIEAIRAWWHNWRTPPDLPVHIRRGRLGEDAARQYLVRAGLEFLIANYRSHRGELDLVFREHDCLVIVEVKTRSQGAWLRPAAAVNARKRRRLSLAALDYLRELRNPPIRIRFDIVEVILRNGQVAQVRHLRNSFSLSPPYRYG
ncbi:MAG TPA: YraN family protein [Candidatus Paceibacterota bacterium]|nr:YraN family protein [Verrucomicrobiota bacterium]HRZ44502.1 YraN family protein [Candidatus Paceibacterota bacterium]HRZ92057.1 YraN family protein [Candidatus Paceibacterota bacterium]